jgi:hypothetical protein
VLLRETGEGEGLRAGLLERRRLGEAALEQVQRRGVLLEESASGWAKIERTIVATKALRRLRDASQEVAHEGVRQRCQLAPGSVA